MKPILGLDGPKRPILKSPLLLQPWSHYMAKHISENLSEILTKFSKMGTFGAQNFQNLTNGGGVLISAGGLEFFRKIHKRRARLLGTLNYGVTMYIKNLFF